MYFSTNDSNTLEKIKSAVDQSFSIPHKHLEEMHSRLTKTGSHEEALLKKLKKRLYDVLVYNLNALPTYIGDSWEQIDLKYREWSVPVEFQASSIQFDWLALFVTNSTLIPRRKTNLHEYVQTFLDEHPWWHYSYCDIWTGTGVVWIQTLKQCTASFLSCIFTDILDENLALASKNIARNGIDLEKITLQQSDLLQKIGFSPEVSYIITANLPYSSQNDIEWFSPFVKSEPERALYWWNSDWLDVYRDFFQQILTKTNEGIVFSYIVVECSRTNGAILAKRLEEQWFDQYFTIHQEADWFGVKRNISLTKKDSF